MRELIQLISSKCRHFTGLSDSQCEKGIAYADVRNKDAPTLDVMYPCFKESKLNTCEHCSFYTPEETERRAEEMVSHAEAMCQAMELVQEDAKRHNYGKRRPGQGKVPCPLCKVGEVFYSVAASNGHMFAKCSTANCVAWME